MLVADRRPGVGCRLTTYFPIGAMAAHPDLENEVEWYLTFGNDYPVSIVDTKSDFAAIAAHPAWKTKWNGT